MTPQQSAIADGLLTPDQASREVGVCVKTILRWCRPKMLRTVPDLVSYRFAKNVIRIKRSDLTAFIEKRRRVQPDGFYSDGLY